MTYQANPISKRLSEATVASDQARSVHCKAKSNWFTTKYITENVEGFVLELETKVAELTARIEQGEELSNELTSVEHELTVEREVLKVVSKELAELATEASRTLEIFKTLFDVYVAIRRQETDVHAIYLID